MKKFLQTLKDFGIAIMVSKPFRVFAMKVLEGIAAKTPNKIDDELVKIAKEVIATYEGK